MAVGLLGSRPISSDLTEYQIYQAPSTKKAVGTAVVCNPSTNTNGLITLFLTSVSGSVSGMITAALSDTAGNYAFLVMGGLCKFFSSDDGVPLTISGVVIGPGQRLIAYSNQGTQMYVSFNGIEEDV